MFKILKSLRRKFSRTIKNPDYRTQSRCIFRCAHIDEYGCWMPDCKHNEEYIKKCDLGKLPECFEKIKLSTL